MGEIKVPNSLLPENIMDTVDKKIKKRRRNEIWRTVTVSVTVAAMLVLLVGVYFRFFASDEGRVNETGLTSGGTYAENESNKKKPGSILDVWGEQDFRLSDAARMYASEQSIRLNRVPSYEALYSYMWLNNRLTGGLSYDIMEDGMINESEFNGSDLSTGAQAPTETEPGTGEGEGDYSGTNTQTEGIDEGDAVKTDGEYIYVMKNNKGRVIILKADGENSEKLDEVDIWNSIAGQYDIEKREDYGDGLWLMEMYVLESKLVVTASYTCYDGYKNIEYTYVVTADLQDGMVAEVHTARQEGRFGKSRMKDGVLYLVTAKYLFYDELKDEQDLVCTAGDTAVEPEDMYYTHINQDVNCNYIISAIDIKNGTKVTSAKVYMGGNLELYMSQNYIYFFDWRYWATEAMEGEKTHIVKFSIENGAIEPVATGIVEGYANDSFSADEYKGNLRLVTTSSEGNHLYILDENLAVTGSIKNLAEGETIRSARFMGDKGYFVTYRNMDPLFTVDLSDPTAPRVTDELKITGYSSYMHFMDEEHLLGIGYETDPDTGMQLGMKVTLFDVSDETNVTVKKNIVYADSYGEALYNHRAILAADSRGLYGFCVSSPAYDAVIGEEDTTVTFERKGNYYLVFVYENGDIREAERLYIESEDEWYIGWDARGIYIGDYFYLVTCDSMQVYDLEAVIGDEQAELLQSIRY